MKKGVVLSAVILITSLLLTACSANQPIDNSENNSTSVTVPAESEVPNETEKSPEKTGVIAEQILNGNDGEIHVTHFTELHHTLHKNFLIWRRQKGGSFLRLIIHSFSDTHGQSRR